MPLFFATLWIAALFSNFLHIEAAADEIRVIPVEPTAQPDSTELRLVFPKEGKLFSENSIPIEIRLEGYPLGINSDFSRCREIRNSEEGQAIHIFVDGRPFFSVNEAIDETSENEEINYDQTIKTTIPYKLSKGVHILRAFPVRSFQESLKKSGCFKATYFYLGSEEKKPSIDLSKPYLTYNQPEGVYSKEKPVLLDFYLSNIELGEDGYKVRLTIDKKKSPIFLHEWRPYYIHGLAKGSHTIQLELLDSKGRVVDPLFKDLQRTITVQ